MNNKLGPPSHVVTHGRASLYEDGKRVDRKLYPGPKKPRDSALTDSLSKETQNGVFEDWESQVNELE